MINFLWNIIISIFLASAEVYKFVKQLFYVLFFPLLDKMGKPLPKRLKIFKSK